MKKITDYFDKVNMDNSNENIFTLHKKITKPISYFFTSETSKQDRMDDINQENMDIFNQKEIDNVDITKQENMVIPCETPFFTNNKSEINVYTDGSCVHNGKKHAKAGIGIYFKDNDERNVSKRIDGKQSNNTAELTAIIQVFDILKKEIQNKQNVFIYTDSKYSILCCGSYGRRVCKDDFKKKNTKTGKWIDIPNKELVKKAFSLFYKNPNVKLLKVEAHTGKLDKHSLGNEQADKLASMSISNYIEDKPRRIYINVPFSKKDIAKSLGAKWDFKKKKWFIMDNMDKTLFDSL